MPSKKRFSIDPVIDHLFNSKSQLGSAKKKRRWGIQLPTASSSGTGNILIAGRPGTGKSTLAFQILKSAAQQGISSFYVSLEESPHNVRGKAKIFGWEKYIYEPDQALRFSRASPQKDQANIGCELVKNATAQVRAQKGLEDAGAVILTALLPRPVDTDESKERTFFWQQYAQLENIVRIAREQVTLTCDADSKLGLLALDGLNMLGFGHRNREQMHRVFDLFRQNNMLGIFTADDRSATQFDSTMADTVVTMTSPSDEPYRISHICVEKSRHIKNTLGKHPYKIIKPNGLTVFPSVHATIAATEPSGGSSKSAKKSEGLFPFGWRKGLTKYLVPTNLSRRGVVAVVGPEGTRKTTIAVNFLTNNLDERKIALYIRLGKGEDRDSIPSKPRYLSEGGSPLKGHKVVCPKSLNGLISSKKATIWRTELKRKSKNRKCCNLIGVDFSPGMLLPEEFVDLIRRLHNEIVKDGLEISRVAIDDVGVIGVDFPLLKHSETTQDLFLSTFVHLVRNFGASLLMAGSTGSFPQANSVVDMSCVLADAVLRTSYGEIFGDRYVLLSGDGIMSEDPDRGETVPAALRLVGKKLIWFDKDRLQGFLGFEVGPIKRPNVRLCLFEGYLGQQIYNKTIPFVLESTCGLSNDPSGESIEIVRYGSGQLDSIHRGVAANAQDAAPRDHTSVVMVDEVFDSDRDGNTQKKQPIREYSNNVLLLAYRKDVLNNEAAVSFNSWEDVYELAETIEKKGKDLQRFSFNSDALETLSCALLDCIATVASKKKTKDAFSCLFDEKVFKHIVDKFVDELEWLQKLLLCGSGLGGDELKVENLKRLIDSGEKDDHKAVTEIAKQSSPKLNKGGGAHRAASPSSKLVSNAGLYLCWYSQLRDLLKECPSLSGKIGVAPLPGGGFTGDWGLIVAPGSVSYALGKKVVDALSSRSEDYHRFVEGVGLPTSIKCKDPAAKLFHGWPGAENLQLRELLKIHRDAHRRRDILDYRHYMLVLSSLARRFTKRFADKPLERESIKELVVRLPDLVKESRKAAGRKL